MSRLPARLAALVSALVIAAAVPATAGAATGPTHLTDAQRATLLRYAEDTWASFVAMTDETTGLPADSLKFDGSRSVQTSTTNIGAYMWSTVVAEALGIIEADEAEARLTKTITTLEGMERHEESGQFYNWYDHRDGAKLTIWPPTGNPIGPDGPILSSVDNGWLAAALQVVSNAASDPDVADRAAALYDSMDFGFYYVPERNRILFHYAPDNGAAPCCYDTIVSESRIASYIGIAKGEIPAREYFGSWRTFPDTCDWSWPETKPLGFDRTYLGVDVFEGSYPYAGFRVVPGWGGSMFEALMPALFVPEEKWGPESWAVNHPLTVAAQIHHGMEEAGYGYWGFSPANIPEGGYDAYGVDAIGMNPGGYWSNNDHTLVDHGWNDPACPREPQPDPPPSAYTNGVVTPHAAFLALRWAPDMTLENLANLEADFPGIYGEWGFRDSVNVDTGRSSDYYLSLDQGIIMAAIGNALADDLLRDAFATKAVRKVLQPIVNMEEFSAGPRRRQAPVTTSETRPAGGSSARIAWFDEVGAQAERNRPAPDVPLPAPAWTRAEAGRGHVTVDWAKVEGAIGYVVHRADAPDGPWQAIDHRAGDLLAVPHPLYVDTTGERGRAAWYAVGALSSIDAAVGPLSPAVEAAPATGGDAAVEIVVDARDARGPVERPWSPIIGSEHLAMLLRGIGPGGRHVGDELAEAFRISGRELGARSVRAHAVFHDSLGVYREVDGRAVYDFDKVDAALERLLETGLRPVVELSFLPRDLASDPGQTVFDYRGIISPPRDMGAWSALVTAFVDHLGERFGRDEVRRWPFEVWNEPNLRVFWSADEAAYFDLYDATARAVKAADPAIRVGGPATAAVGWVDDLLAHAVASGAPVDFVSTHTYGLPPLDLRPILARFGRNDLPTYWTEWGISPKHGSPINDSVWGAPIVCAGMRSAAGRLDALAYWVASDHFVELGEPERLFHGGFGLLTVGNLRKPRFWALRMLQLLGDTEVGCSLGGDGAGGLVDAWATRDADGRIAIAAWNGTIDQSKADGDPLLDRAIRLTIDGLPTGEVVVRHHRIDATHSNIVRHWDGGDWPDEAGWQRLSDHDQLEELGPERRATVRRGGPLTLEFDLPMPGVSLIEVAPDAS